MRRVPGGNVESTMQGRRGMHMADIHREAIEKPLAESNN